MNNPLSNHFCCPPNLSNVVTVQSVAGIKGLNNCFVHVIDNNTVYYIDNKHHITEISAQIVEVEDYNTTTNPLNLRNQVVYDTKTEILYYFDNHGTAHEFDPKGRVEFDKILNRPTYNGETISSNTDIPKVPTTIGELTDGNRVATLEQQVKDLEGSTGAPDKDVVVGQGVIATAGTIQLTAPTENLKTGETDLITTPFPIANENQAGAISVADYLQFKNSTGGTSELKTINGESLQGTGNIEIPGGLVWDKNYSGYWNRYLSRGVIRWAVRLETKTYGGAPDYPNINAGDYINGKSFSLPSELTGMSIGDFYNHYTIWAGAGGMYANIKTSAMPDDGQPDFSTCYAYGANNVRLDGATASTITPIFCALGELPRPTEFETTRPDTYIHNIYQVVTVIIETIYDLSDGLYTKDGYIPLPKTS